MYAISLHNGTVLENLELNGNNFIAEGIIEDDVFTNNLATVSITNGTDTYNCKNMDLVINRVEKGRSWFVLREKTEQELKEEAREKEIAELHQAFAVLLGGE